VSRVHVLLAALAIATPLLAAPTPAATGTAAKPHYTHGSDLTKESCPIYENYPRPGVPVRAWVVHRTHRKDRPPVGVRYTYGAYAMVIDHTTSGDPHWGIIARSCLTDPYAYNNSGTTRLGDKMGVGGHGEIKPVLLSAAHAGKQRLATIHLDSTGTLRDNPRSFPVGNLRKGDPFQITTTHCGHHARTDWILGYSPTAKRWAFVEAMHLPACH
jgi:hypothetical protein